MSKVEASQKTQELLVKVPSKQMSLIDWNKWYESLEVGANGEVSHLWDALDIKLISVEGLVAELTDKINDYNKAYRKHLKKCEEEPNKRIYSALANAYLTRIGELDWVLVLLRGEQK